jgi:alcohol dehydrogenase
MKAVQCKKTGSPKVLNLINTEKPIPKSDEVLIKVFSSSVTRGDVNLRKIPRFVLYIIGFFFGFKPMDITGVEFAGIVEETGNSVTNLKKGDKVFGTTTGLKYGANAEFVCVPEKSKMGVIKKMPEGVSFNEAAAIPVGAMTALHILKKVSEYKNKEVLIYGASGSVGSYAVQIAKYFEANVTGICSTKNISMVNSIGADKVIDYTKEDFNKGNIKYDVIFDAVGKISKSKCKNVLKENGSFLSIKSPTKEKNEYMDFISEMIEIKKLRPIIDKIYAIEEIREAHSYVDQGHKRGNVVVQIINEK